MQHGFKDFQDVLYVGILDEVDELAIALKQSQQRTMLSLDFEADMNIFSHPQSLVFLTAVLKVLLTKASHVCKQPLSV